MELPIPFYNKESGINLYKSDACDRCSLFPCPLFTDLALNGQGSKWHESRIVAPGERGGQVCQSFREYIPPKDRSERDDGFGKRVSQTEANRWDGLPDDQRRPLL